MSAAPGGALVKHCVARLISKKPRSRAKSRGGVSTLLLIYYFHGLRGKRALREMAHADQRGFD